MANVRIRGFRSWEPEKSQAERVIDAYVRRTQRDFGRSDVPPGVQAATKDLARAEGLTLEAALSKLTAEAGSFAALVERIARESKRLRRRNNRQRKRAEAERGSAEPVGAIFKHTQLVEGGAPGLGGVRKPLRVPRREK